MFIANFVCETKQYSLNNPRHIRITKSITSFIAGTLQSLSVVEADKVKDMIKAIDLKVVIPNRKHLSTNLLTEMACNISEVLTKKLIKASITIDIWSNRQMRSFIGITAHFIFNWKLETAMLVCKRFKGCHTADNIMTLYEEIMNDFDIFRKVTHITTDNASNILKVFSMPGYNKNVAISTNVETHSSDSELDKTDQVVFNILCNNVFYFLPKHDGCFAHTLQLVVRDGMKEAANLSKIICKASAIVSHVRKFTRALENLENFKKLQTANITRWNSELKMI